MNLRALWRSESPILLMQSVTLARELLTGMAFEDIRTTAPGTHIDRCNGAATSD
jgi:hypothetical protein